MNMNKIKLTPGVASVILLAAFLGGGTTLFTVAIFFLCFCELDEKIHNTMVKIFTFFVGITIVTLGWNIIMSGCNLVLDAITKLFVSINGFLDPSDVIEYTKFITPIESIIGLADGFVSLLILIAKVAFVIGVLTNKKGSSNFVSKKIEEYVNKAIVWVQNFTAPVQAPQAPAQPAPAPQAPQA
ncbi:MAG: hypothetical protein II625_00690 [Bacilli bacterium]|nr:hypothetical protein [Bacilli bacterium]